MENIEGEVISSKIIEYGEGYLKIQNTIITEDGELIEQVQILDFNGPTDWA